MAQSTVVPSQNGPTARGGSTNSAAPSSQTNNSPLPNSESSSTLADALSRPGSVTFRDTPLAEVILILSEQWNVNIIAGSDINGNVNGTFKNEALKSILDSILIANGLLFQQVGSSLVVLPASDSSGSQASFRVEVLSAPVSSQEEMEELIAALRLQMSSEGELVPVSASGKLTILDTPDRIEAVKRLLAQIALETPPPTPNYVSTTNPDLSQASPSDLGSPNLSAPPPSLMAVELRPQYILVSDLQQPLARLVGEENLAVVEKENSVVVFGDESVQHKARLLLNEIDRPRAQVRITGYIYDVDLGEMEKLGVDWARRIMSSGIDANGVPNRMALSSTGLLSPSAVANSANTLSGVVEGAVGGAAAGGAAGGAAGAAAQAVAPAGGQFLFRTLSSHAEVQALIQALEETSSSRLLADPHVTVVDRHQASLGIVTEIPVQQLTQTQQGGAIGTTEFKEAGITLDVTPRIANDGTIEMEVQPTFSVLSGFQNGQPIIDTRRASTVVRVNHGQALVIGGLRSKTTVETVKGIPGLMNIKYLGALFRTHDTDIRESEMVVFIMPEIVGYCGGGLPREMVALDVAQQQLSRVQTAVDGPCSPDCKDKHCPNHYERPRIHNGMYDRGLIGSYDAVFIERLPPEALMQTIQGEDRIQTMDGNPSLPKPTLPLQRELPESHFSAARPALPQSGKLAQLVKEQSVNSSSAASSARQGSGVTSRNPQEQQLGEHKSSRRVIGKPASYRR